MINKIVIAIYKMDIGGAQKIAAFLANVCTKHCGEVHLIVLRKSEVMVQIESAVQMHVCLPQKAEKERNFITKLKEIIYGTIETRKLIKETQPDIVVAFLPIVSFISFLATRLTKTKLVCTERNDPHYYSSLWKTLLRFVYAHSDGLVFQTEGAFNFYRKYIHCPFAIIVNPAIGRMGKTSVFQGVRAPYLFSAGRFHPKKGFDVLLHAFAQVRQKYPEYRLILYGDGEGREDLEECIRHLGITEAVRLPGVTSDAVEKAKDASAFVLSSLSEGIPNILIEALMAGIPCVAADCSPGGAKLLLEDGKYGVLVPKGDADALAKGILRIIEDCGLQAKFQSKREEFIARIHPERIENEWLSFLASLIK